MNLVETTALETGSSSSVSFGGNRSIGAILIDAGRLNPEAAERILRVQKEQGKRFGDAALELGLITQADIQFALSHQFDYRYLASGDNSVSEELVAAYQPFSPVVEQLRALRSQLMLRWFDGEKQSKSIAIVSSGHGDGRSFIAANLAIIFSQLGERTLLIDADMRNPRQHELFKLGNVQGLSNYLAGLADDAVVMRIPSLLGLSVLPAGSIPPNPQELLGRPSFTKLLSEASASFDVVIIDTPAAGEFADSQTIAARSGAALVIARKNFTPAVAMTKVVRGTQQSGACIVGSVLNVA